MKVKNKKSNQDKFKKIREEALNKRGVTDTTDIFMKDNVNKNYSKAEKKIQELILKSDLKDQKELVEAIKKDDEIVSLLFKENKEEIEKFYRENIKVIYSKYSYEIAKENGGMATYVKKDERLINKIINEDFKGSNFSTRIWKQQEKTKQQLKEVLLKGQNSFYSNKQIARQLSKKLGVSRYRCETLIRTELARIYTDVEKESYIDTNIRQYEFLATLDARTTYICQEEDGQVYYVADMTPGNNAPPMHPNCRSDTVPYFDLGYPERMGRNLETGKSEYMDKSIKTYKDYQEKYIEWF